MIERDPKTALKVNQINPRNDLKSILRGSGLEPGEKLGCAVKLLTGQTLRQFARDVLRVNPTYLSRSIKDPKAVCIQRRAAAALDLDREDIWPAAEDVAA